MEKWEKHFANILHWGNRINITAYVGTTFGYFLATHELPPYEILILWLTSIGVGYGIKDLFLDGKTHISDEELEEYPSWVKNHLEPHLDGYSIKRRILMESKGYK